MRGEGLIMLVKGLLKKKVPKKAKTPKNILKLRGRKGG